MDTKWDNRLDRLNNLRRDKKGSHERPHKPVLLLNIVDLLDRGVLTANPFAYFALLPSTNKGLKKSRPMALEMPTSCSSPIEMTLGSMSENAGLNGIFTG